MFHMATVLFTHTAYHGNTINKERETRWSMNVRFKGQLTPYGDKLVGETFKPIQKLAATQIGYSEIG